MSFRLGISEYLFISVFCFDRVIMFFLPLMRFFNALRFCDEFFVKDVRYRFSDICMLSSRLVDPGSRFAHMDTVKRAILATLQQLAGSSNLNYTDSCFQHLNTLLVELNCPTISFTLNFFSTGTFFFNYMESFYARYLNRPVSISI